MHPRKRLASCLVTLRNWLFLITCGACTLGLAECIPTRNSLEDAVASNVLGSATAVIDAAFFVVANALLNPLTPPPVQ